MTVEANALWSLLINLLSGLVGAAIGLGGARWLDDKRERRRRQNLITALCFEIRANNANIITVLKDKDLLYARLDDSVWLTLRAEIGNFVPPAIVDDLWRAYAQIAQMRFQAKKLLSANHSESTEAEARLRKWLSDLNLASNKLRTMLKSGELSEFFDKTSKTYTK